MSETRPSLDDLRIDRDDRPQPPSRLWWAVLLIVVLIAAAFGVSRLARGGAPEVATVLVRESSAAADSTVLNASGYVTARRQATVSSKVTGKVVEVLIEEGMTVDDGQVMARLDTSNIGASLRLAEAQSAAARTALRETEVRIEEARLELDRVENLLRQGVSSQAELDRARAEVDSLEARLDRQREEAAVSDRQVELRRQEMEDRIIRAPFAGVVVSKDAQPGEMISPVSAGGGFTRTGIATVVDMSSLEIEIDVNEAYIQRVSPGQVVSAVLDAYPDWEIPCHVIAIIPTADRQRATVEVRVGFDELDPRILPDMGVKVGFRSEERSPSEAPQIRIPATAVRRDGEREVVFLVDGETAERRAVRLAEATGDTVAVSSGLDPGERLIVDPPAGLEDGDAVKER